MFLLFSLLVGILGTRVRGYFIRVFPLGPWGLLSFHLAGFRLVFFTPYFVIIHPFRVGSFCSVCLYVSALSFLSGLLFFTFFGGDILVHLFTSI